MKLAVHSAEMQSQSCVKQRKAFFEHLIKNTNGMDNDLQHAGPPSSCLPFMSDKTTVELSAWERAPGGALYTSTAGQFNSSVAAAQCKRRFDDLSEDCDPKATSKRGDINRKRQSPALLTLHHEPPHAAPKLPQAVRKSPQVLEMSPSKCSTREAVSFDFPSNESTYSTGGWPPQHESRAPNYRQCWSERQQLQQPDGDEASARSDAVHDEDMCEAQLADRQASHAHAECAQSSSSSGVREAFEMEVFPVQRTTQSSTQRSSKPTDLVHRPQGSSSDLPDSPPQDSPAGLLQAATEREAELLSALQQAQEALKRKDRQCENMQTIIKELVDSKSMLSRAKVELRERYYNLQNEYMRLRKVADLCRVVSRQNFSKHTRTRKELIHTQDELLKSKRVCSTLMETNRKLTDDNYELREKVALLERLKVVDEPCASVCRREFFMSSMPLY